MVTETAEAVAGAPAPEPVAQETESGVAEEQKSESGELTEAQVQLAAIKRFVESADSPEVLDALFAAAKKEVKEQSGFYKDAFGRGRQGGRAELLNDMRLQQEDATRHEEAKTQLADAVRALGDDEIEPAARKRYVSTIQQKAQEVRDHELRLDSLKVIKGAPGWEAYTDADFERVSKADGSPWGTWLREHLQTYGDVRERAGYQRGLEEAGRKTANDEKLLELIAKEKVVAEGHVAQPRVGGGAAAGKRYRDLTDDERRSLTPEQIDAETRRFVQETSR